ncbi:DUF4209 domain-containing protein [Bacillus cereus]|uniref:DUF4209 domain-containing protein n=1 Tax=Bacillus cereus TaxID=1396 RepID=UPI000BFC89FE|nr:DUF4209 domain-containing protein [Bacillus cereus]PGV79296.1 hypothetical protein COD84_08560 [Bacillus cereus]
MERNLWDEINAIDLDVTYGELESAICRGLERILETSDEKNAGYKEIQVLRSVFALALDLDNPQKPYKNRLMLNNGENNSIDLDNFTEEMEEVLKAIVTEKTFESSFMQCRVLDVYFTLSKDYSVQDSLFSSLMKLIDDSFSKNMFALTKDILERSFQLFGRSGKKGNDDPRTKSILEKINTIIGNYNMERPLEKSIEIFIYKILDLTCKYKFVKDEGYPRIAFGIARVLEENKEFETAISWWELCAKWNRKLRQNDQANKCVENKALCFYKLALKELEGEEIQYFNVVEKYNSAILNLRKVNGNEETVKQWILEKAELQKKLPGQLSYIELPGIDITLEIEEIEAHLVGKNPMEILGYIGYLAKSLPYEKILNEDAPKFLSMFEIMPKQILNGECKTVHISQNDLEFPEYLIQRYRIQYERAALHIRHVIELLHNCHFLRIQELLLITSDNPFIPEGRELIVAKGLRAGLNGDYATSLSILIPQFENSIRFLLEQNGEIVTNLGDDTVQEEKNLNQLLLYKKLEEIFGFDTVKDLKYLFVHKGGCNLRNRVSHGLMSDFDFRSPDVVYAFGVILRIVFYYRFGYIA